MAEAAPGGRCAEGRAARHMRDPPTGPSRDEERLMTDRHSGVRLIASRIRSTSPEACLLSEGDHRRGADDRNRRRLVPGRGACTYESPTSAIANRATPERYRQ